MDDAGEVAAMQFAGGMSMARVAQLWDRDAEWVEAAVRMALLRTIPIRDGGTKVTRVELRAERQTEELQDAGQLKLLEV